MVGLFADKVVERDSIKRADVPTYNVAWFCV